MSSTPVPPPGHHPARGRAAGRQPAVDGQRPRLGQHGGIVAELPALIDELTAGTFTAAAVPVPLSEVEQAWNTPTDPRPRVVITMSD
ncbi:hypothetical protein [Actinokineospora sp. NBRC 105648]|uniref:hypothetical protein n=1 Tax=Actinokineospora sp. NBRC 105648 TaxID=3032206 RepID=UPI0025527886|nr:hypothetical protein [Actinokineospora sp. NBRC 105648]